MQTAVDLRDVMEVLERTPRALRGLLEGAPERLVERPYGEGTWSAREVVAHLIYGEQADWLPRLEWILEHGESKAFAPFNRAGHKELMRLSVRELLYEFERLRREGLATLRAKRLGAAELARTGRHPALGVVTAGQLLSTWAVHDLNHVAQVCKAMSIQYLQSVGAWEQYLSILRPPSPR